MSKQSDVIAEEIVAEILKTAHDHGRAAAMQDGPKLIMARIGEIVAALANPSEVPAPSMVSFDAGTRTTVDRHHSQFQLEQKPNRADAIVQLCKEVGAPIRIRDFMGYFNSLGYRNAESLQKAAIADERLYKELPGVFYLAEEKPSE